MGRVVEEVVVVCIYMGPGGEGWGPAYFPFGGTKQQGRLSLSLSQSVSQLLHGPAPRSPLYRLAVRLRHSRSNTSTEYSLPGATQLRESARIKGDKAGVRNQRPHATVASPPSVRRPRQRAPPAAGAAREFIETCAGRTFSAYLAANRQPRASPSVLHSVSAPTRRLATAVRWLQVAHNVSQSRRAPDLC